MSPAVLILEQHEHAGHEVADQVLPPPKPVPRPTMPAEAMNGAMLTPSTASTDSPRPHQQDDRHRGLQHGTDGLRALGATFGDAAAAVDGVFSRRCLSRAGLRVSTSPLTADGCGHAWSPSMAREWSRNRT